MNGGPARKPSDPMEDTAAMPGPAGVSGWRPAALNISGTPLATPRPTRNMPARPTAGRADEQEGGERHGGQQRAPAQQRDGADAVVDRVAHQAPGGHAAREGRVGERGDARGGAGVLAQEEPAPVAHRALRDHHEEA